METDPGPEGDRAGAGVGTAATAGPEELYLSLLEHALPECVGDLPRGDVPADFRDANGIRQAIEKVDWTGAYSRRAG